MAVSGPGRTRGASSSTRSGLAPGLATAGEVDGAADGSARLQPAVRAIYEEVTAAAKLQTLEDENAALKEQLAAALKAVSPPAAGSGGVSAAGAAGWGRGAREPAREEGGEFSPPKVRSHNPSRLQNTAR